MIPAPLPDDEAGRQAALERYAVLDSLPERRYDDITALIAMICRAPIALVGLIDRDRNWLKSRHGIDIEASPRALSFCGHAIVSGEAVFVVEDAREDARFADNPIVAEHGVVGYAGAPLVDRDGFALGTLCVFSTAPLQLEVEQASALEAMARQVMYLLERGLQERRLDRASRELAARNVALARFASAVTHELRAPLGEIAELAAALERHAGDRLDDADAARLAGIGRRAARLDRRMDELLEGRADGRPGGERPDPASGPAEAA